MMLLSDTAYHSFIREVEALNTTTIGRLTRSRRHELLAAAHQGPMSTDAWIEERWISEAVLPRPRRAPKLPALPVPHAPTCSRGNAALAAHARSRDSSRHPGDGLSARQCWPKRRRSTGAKADTTLCTCSGIPDEYERDQPELIALLKE